MQISKLAILFVESHTCFRLPSLLSRCVAPLFVLTPPPPFYPLIFSQCRKCGKSWSSPKKKLFPLKAILFSSPPRECRPEIVFPPPSAHCRLPLFPGKRIFFSAKYCNGGSGGESKQHFLLYRFPLLQSTVESAGSIRGDKAKKFDLLSPGFFCPRGFGSSWVMPLLLNLQKPKTS